MPVLISAVLFLVVVGALIDIITKQDGQVKHLPKLVWIFLVIFLPLIGSILWFTIGREYNAPVDRGTFADLRRRPSPAPAPAPRQAAYDMRPARTTEEELAELDREIEFHNEQARIERLEAELEKRRKESE
ncbi:PLD nuclease N-terminal domain-containing protein [Glaciibacter superstes]|uniref:PLD nuclease N-terminal domain-containing protein n=1 Tax=Glaciibacter superstes TaxID=501023 RepID=UPI0003B52052|nr:PLD nuclease N-terminal domain-containing protein [Glaciibacter superstes]